MLDDNSVEYDYLAKYRRLFQKQGDVENSEAREHAFFFGKSEYIVSQSEYIKIPGSPIAYWVGPAFLNSFNNYSISTNWITKSNITTINTIIILSNIISPVYT